MSNFTMSITFIAVNATLTWQWQFKYFFIYDILRISWTKFKGEFVKIYKYYKILSVILKISLQMIIKSANTFKQKKNNLLALCDLIILNLKMSRKIIAHILSYSCLKYSVVYMFELSHLSILMIHFCFRLHIMSLINWRFHQ